MDLWEAVVVAFRRWYVMLPVLLIGVFVAWRLAESVAPVHEASATVQYLPPAVNTFDQETAFAFAANPYSDLRSLAFATELSVQSEDFAAELDDRGFDAEFSVETDRREPVLYIITESTSRGSALGTLDAVLVFVEEEALERQEQQFGGDPSLFVLADVLRRDTTTATDLTSRTRARVLLLVVAGVVAMGSAVLVESISGAIKRARGDSGITPEGPDVVWFGVPLQTGQQTPSPLPPQQPHLAPAPEAPARLTGTSGEHSDDGSAQPHKSRWTR